MEPIGYPKHTVHAVNHVSDQSSYEAVIFEAEDLTDLLIIYVSCLILYGHMIHVYINEFM